MTVGTARAIAARNWDHERRNIPTPRKEGDRIPPSERLGNILFGGLAVGLFGAWAGGVGYLAGHYAAAAKIGDDLQSYVSPNGIAMAHAILHTWELTGGILGGVAGVGKMLSVEGLRNCLKAGFTGKEPPPLQP